MYGLELSDTEMKSLLKNSDFLNTDTLYTVGNIVSININNGSQQEVALSNNRGRIMLVDAHTTKEISPVISEKKEW